MVLSSLSFGNGGPAYNNDNAQPPGALDSITLGQLKSMVNSAPKPKQVCYKFEYGDEDTVMNEIDEFFSYVEAPQVEENMRAWEGSFEGSWLNATKKEKARHISVLLESLEHKNTEIRFTNARRLFYILQGNFKETSSPEHQLQCILNNCVLVQEANGINNIVEAIKIANGKHDLLSSLSDSDVQRLGITPAEKQDCIEEVNTELSVYLGMLYLIIEVLKDTEDFADELMSLDPPLPVYLFHMVAGLKDKSAKGYPLKKVLLLLWKTILACCGGSRDLARVKKIARELAGLPVEREETVPIKSSPFDIQTFRQETSVKYPTFTPPPPPSTSCTSVKTELSGSTFVSRSTTFSVSPLKLAEAYSPIPVRHHYHHGDEGDFQQPPNGPPSQNMGQPGYPSGVPAYNPNPTQQTTPVPTPPPSPRPKKQQYQTDQNRPFLFPFSRSQMRPSRGKDARLVPFAIDEADKLYNKHMHISVSLQQMWRTREDCMIEESGLQRMPGADTFSETFDSILSLNSSLGLQGSGFTSSSLLSGSDKKSSIVSTRSELDDSSEELPDVALLDSKIAEVEGQYEQTCRDEGRNSRKAFELKQRRADLLRLRRVEQIYSSTLPALGACVLVLLKLLLAAVSAANSSNQPPPSASSSAFPPGVPAPVEQPPLPPPTLDEVDTTRHREIMSKAVSAILLLTLKWFKVSHVMKFHFLGQVLLESNCLLLILKMFTIQEVANTVTSKADVPERNFFQYCLKYSQQPHVQGFEDRLLVQTRLRPSNEVKDDEEIEMITDFSWRNLFSTINFVKIMQKLSKHRSHRILILVQYKSSAVLKRILKVSHPMLELNVLKLIKSQVPYCGRKWRQSNMKVITSIYLKCRPDLRDEWLTGAEVDDAQDALLQEQALRKLVKFYNNKRYGSIAAHTTSRDSHRRSSSVSVPLDGLTGPEFSAMVRPVGTPNVVEADVFPPLRAQAPDPSIFLPYTTEDIAFEEEYEEYLNDLGMSDDHVASGGALFGGTSAWSRLPHIGPEIADGISDSESIASIGDLGDDGKFGGGLVDSDRESMDENRNNWEHMSPKTMAALPKSPVGGHRRSSSGSSLRPIIPFGLDDNSAVELDDDEPELGPMPREESEPFGQGAGVDEVEYAYGL